MSDAFEEVLSPFNVGALRLSQDPFNPEPRQDQTPEEWDREALHVIVLKPDQVTERQRG